MATVTRIPCTLLVGHGYTSSLDTVILYTGIIITRILSGHRTLYDRIHWLLFFHVLSQKYYTVYAPLIHGYTNARTTACHILVIIVTWILGISLLHGMYGLFILDIWILVPLACIIVPCYSRIPVLWLFPVIDIVIPVTGYMSCWYAMCGIPHLLFPVFPLSCYHALF